jgi:murein L,D-transpeptidase YafK
MRRSFLTFAVVLSLSYFSWAEEPDQEVYFYSGEDVLFESYDQIQSVVGSFCPILSDLAKSSQRRAPASKINADFIVVDKSRKLLHLLRENRVIRTYDVALGKNPKGHKTQQGDNKTPEGLYMIDWKNPNSDFHLSLHINYPNAKDREQARRRGVDPGGDIFIHGLPNESWKRPFLGHPKNNWTRGCVAVTNQEIEEVFSMVLKNTPIELCP